MNGVAGGSIAFQMQLKDRFLNNVTNPAPAPTLALQLTATKGNVKYSSSSQLLANGLYQLQYLVNVSGNYQLKLLVNQGNVEGSPFNVWIVPAGAIFPSNCFAFGPNLNGTIAGTAGFVYVQSQDVFGNNLTSSENGTWLITFEGTTGFFEVEYVATGVYFIAYNVTTAGKWNMNITVDGFPIRRSPFPIRISPNVTYAPTSAASGDGLTATRTDEQASFSIIAYDRYGNLRNTGGDQWEVQIQDKASGAAVVSGIPVTDASDGSYTASYVLSKSGDYLLFVQLHGLNVNGSPFPLQCKWAGLSTNALIGIGVGGVGFFGVILVSIWVYRTRCSKRRLYTPLDDQKQ